VVLVVAENGGIVGGKQQPQTDRRRHLAVRKVMHNLPRGPLAWSGTRVQILGGCSGQGFGDDAVTVFVLIDQFFADPDIHVFILAVFILAVFILAVFILAF